PPRARGAPSSTPEGTPSAPAPDRARDLARRSCDLSRDERDKSDDHGDLEQGAHPPHAAHAVEDEPGGGNEDGQLREERDQKVRGTVAGEARQQQAGRNEQ